MWSQSKDYSCAGLEVVVSFNILILIQLTDSVDSVPSNSNKKSPCLDLPVVIFFLLNMASKWFGFYLDKAGE